MTKSISWIVNFIHELAKQGFTGRVEINFFQGGIANVNKMESFKAP